MTRQQTDELAELKKIAKIRVDHERHRLAAIKEEAARLDAEKQTLKSQIIELHEAEETSPAALINAQAYLNSLSNKARDIEDKRLHARERTKQQREKIKSALASKIRIDGMDSA
ncbi:MAG: hypothetical protein AAFW68_02110 [Pseudomonadota bacterium]